MSVWMAQLILAVLFVVHGVMLLVLPAPIRRQMASLGAAVLHLRRLAYIQALGDAVVLTFVAAVGYLTSISLDPTEPTIRRRADTPPLSRRGFASSCSRVSSGRSMCPTGPALRSSYGQYSPVTRSRQSSVSSRACPALPVHAAGADSTA